MIKLTRIQGDPIYINEDNIQWIEPSPDTTITFINGNRFIVKESIEEIIHRIEKNMELNSIQKAPEEENLSSYGTN